ncbi:MAG: PHP domain-containing protein [Gemmatimonadota bacterium]
MKLTSDWHIHSRNSCDGACMTVADLVRGAAEKGIADFGLTDHLHTPYNLPDVAASRREFDGVAPSPRFHFGIEVSCVSRWELEELARGGHEKPTYGLRQGGPPGTAPAIGVGAEELEAHGVEFVVGGTHWPLYVPFERQAIIRDYHRQNMFLATHPLVDIVAHPWWWMGHWQAADKSYPAEPWFDDFGHVPQSMHEEFAAAAVAGGTRVEINLCAMLLNPHYPPRFKEQYAEYLAGLKTRGVALTIGSDCHNAQYDIDFETPARMLEAVGIGPDSLWRLPPGTAS